ncbi:MAG: hypothetical protein KTR31_02005 [Myxococcales bacterium]|nr:hypothetical protein [Myxococcales bacterium]
MLWFLTACSSPPQTPATEPDAAATRAVVDALCKVAEGASQPCERNAKSAVIEGAESLSVAAYLDKQEETLGQFTFEGRAVLGRADGTQMVTRFSHFGWGRAEAFEKGVHYWAVLSATPIVDWVLRDPERPALAALHRGSELGDGVLPAPPFQALRGWTFLQGVKVELKHAEILEAVRPSIAKLESTTPHTLEIRIASEMGSQVFSCHVDGQPAPEVCTLAKTAPWPAGIGWELRQGYLLVPEGSFGASP